MNQPKELEETTTITSMLGPGKCGIIEKDEHTSAFIVLETLIVMADRKSVV